MATDALTNQVVAAQTDRTISIAVATLGGKSNPLGSCRIYTPLYQMTPEFQAKYLASGKVKTIKYNDIYHFLVPNVSQGSMVNAILSNGIANMKRLVVVPILSASANGNISPLLSPLTSDGGTPTMQLSLSNFNVQISGKNIYQQNQEYDWEQFIWEVRPSNNINGGLNDGLSTGLISQLDWQNQFRYYVVDLSRRVPSEDNVPKSLTLLCKSNIATAKNIDLYCFVEY